MGKIIIPNWLETLDDHFGADHFQLYLVGGAVRDQLLDRPVGEWDFCTNAHPKDIERLLRSFHCVNIGTIGQTFGTITGRFNAEQLEVTTYRNESYDPDSRKPQVIFGQTLREDLSRRDFTINAIAIRPKTGEIHDPFQGRQDLEAKLIRAVGNARERFAEDPLRMLRAIRFMATLEFRIEPTTEQAIEQERDRFAILSAERVAAELNKILLSKQPSIAIEELVKTKLIAYVLPELIPSIDLEFDPREHKDIYHHILQVLDNTPPKLELRWCALLHDIAKPETRRKIGGEYHFLGHEFLGAKLAKQILRRLKYSNEFVDYVSKLVYLHQRVPNDDGLWTDGAVRRFVRDAGETLEDLFIFAAADNTGTNEQKLAVYAEKRAVLQQRIKELEEQAEIAKIKSPLDGQELMKIFNRPAGPWIKPVKDKLLAMVLDGELKEKDKEKAEQIARQLMDSNE